MSTPKSHPRFKSLKTRDTIVDGVNKGITSIHGLIAHGRGEAFDYLLGEKTNEFAIESINSASAMLLLAKHPVISVNGNTAILVPSELVKLSEHIPAKLEVNIFHISKEREKKIRRHLIKAGAREVLLPERDKRFMVPFIEHNRRYVNRDGIFSADVVFVPLEDGDRASALIKSGKRVITIDMNPLSRTAQCSDITIVDNIIRAVPLLIERIMDYKKTKDKGQLKKIVDRYDNKRILAEALWHIRQYSLIL